MKRWLEAPQPGRQPWYRAPRMLPRWPALVTVLLGGLLLMAAALYNGYPLTFWDTRAYVEHAGSLLPRPDRLVGYSLFIRALSWGLTLWPVVFAQCLLVAWLLRRVAQKLLGRTADANYLFLIGLLTLGTALPWIAGQLMADIFTPILVLALWLLVQEPPADPAERAALPYRLERAALLGLIAVCMSVHLTHFPIALGLLGLTALVLRLSGAPQVWRRLRAPALTLLIGLCAIVGFNTARSGRVSLAAGGDAFVLGHLVESGIASTMLAKHCGKRDYMLCPHRDRLPLTTDTFLWVDVLDIDPWDHPEEMKAEAHRLLRDSLLEHPWMHIKVAADYTVRVLARFETGEGLDNDAMPLIEPQLERYAPFDLPAYRAARQQHDAIPVKTLRVFHTPLGWLMIAGGLLVVGYALRLGPAGLRDPVAFFLLFVFVALFFNAAISGNMSGVYSRYESRLVWLLGVGLWAAWEQDRARQREEDEAPDEAEAET